MADPCIVCLGDLASTEIPGPVSSSDADIVRGDLTDVKSENTASVKHEVPEVDFTVPNLPDPRRESQSATSFESLSTFRRSIEGDESQVIAHLLPCGHNLHDECLRPWVERANSCPICRANFNVVELKHSINGNSSTTWLNLTIRRLTCAPGPSFSSYIVEDKQQVAEIDPSMLMEDDLIDDYAQLCIFCEQLGEDDVLLLCDGCDSGWHTYCAGLHGIPAGAWYCRFCVEAGGGNRITPGARRRLRPPLQADVTRGTSRRQQRSGTRQGMMHGPSPGSSAWAQVWQSVWHSLNLDLDFPWDDEADNTTAQRTEAQQREIAEWHRRFQVAERQGSAARFRDTATTLLPRNTLLSPKPESQEELRAWNAFDKAKELQQAELLIGNGRNKRKSVTASPVEPITEPGRKLKRPKTRRTEELGETSSDGASSSRRPLSPAPQRPGRPSLAQSRPDGTSTGPSFFQSLLKEVESAPAAVEWDEQLQSPGDQAVPSSPALSFRGRLSPGSSPLGTNYSSPRARSASPPPLHLSRPSSPPPLTSRIEPIFTRRVDSLSGLSSISMANNDDQIVYQRYVVTYLFPGP